MKQFVSNAADSQGKPPEAPKPLWQMEKGINSHSASRFAPEGVRDKVSEVIRHLEFKAPLRRFCPTTRRRR